MVEVEFRGPLAQEDYARLESKLSKDGSFVKEKRRLLIDYSSGLTDDDIRDRNLDIRLRITNHEPEIIIKTGTWGGSDARTEISVMLKKGQFLNMVEAYAALGYTKGVLCIRNSKIYQYQDIEFALVEVPNHSYYFEAEMEVTDDTFIARAQPKIKTTCSELGLSIYTDEEFFRSVEKLDAEANVHYDFNKHGREYFSQHYKAYL